MRRRFLSVLLALSMVLTLVPATAWADEMPTEPAGQETPVEIPDETPEDTQGPEVAAPETAPEEEADAEPAETPAEDTANETENADENNADVEIPDAEAEAPKAEEEADAEDGIMLLEEGDEAADASGMPAAVDGKITLTADVTLKSVYTVTETVELDLSGHKISAEDGSNFSGNSLICVNGGNLTITDSGKTRDASLDEKTGTVTDYTGGSIVFDGAGRPKSVINVQGDGTLTLKGGKISHVTVDSKAGNSGIAVFAGSTANIEGGYIISQEASVIPQGEGATLNIKGGVIRSLDNGAYMGNGLAANGGTVTNMTGGTLIGEIQSQGYIACCFYHPQSGELNISGGTIYSKDGVAVCIRNGSMNITEGATLISNGDSSKSGKIGDLKDVVHGTVLQVDYAPGYNHNDDPREISITGGTFTGAADKIINVNNAEGYKAVKNFVQGGIFNKAIDETYVTEGFECKGNDDGTFGIAAKKLVVNTEEGEAPVISGVYVPNTDNSNKEEGVEAAGSTVTFDASNEGATDEQKKAATVNIEPSTIGSLAETTEVTNVEIRTNAGTVTLDAAALEALHANAAEAAGEEEKQIVLEVKQVEDKPANTVAAYEIKLTMAEDETSLLPVGSENGNVTITVEYTGDADKDGNVSVYYAKDKNTIVEKIATVKPVNGKVTFTTGHLSMYSIATDATLADANVAKIGDTAYPSLKAAVDAAETGATITLLRDTTIDGCIDVNGKAITIDGQGHSVKAMDTYADGQGFKPSTKTETTNSGTNTSGHYSMLRVASGKDAAKAELTLKNVTLDAKQQVRVIYCGPNSKLTIEDGTMITGGMGVSEKNGAATSYIGGVYMNSTSELIMNGGTITGNTSAGEYANDGYLEYSGDLWIGNNAKATLNGGTIGKVFANATVLGGKAGGELHMPEDSNAEIETVFVEAGADHTGKVVEYAGGTIHKVLMPLDYDEDDEHVNRPVASITEPEKGIAFGNNEGSFMIPDGVTATIIQDGKLTNPVAIGEGATLVIPADKTVTVIKPVDGEVPAITNNGTLQVDGKLIAGANENDDVFVKIEGEGTIEGGNNIDLDDTTYKTVTITFDGNDYNAATQVMKFTIKKDDGKVSLSSITWPAPKRSGYEFKGWFTDKNTTTEVDKTGEISDDTTYYAKWERTTTSKPSSRPSAGGGGGAATNSTVTISGDGSNIKADVKISNGTATIGKVDDIKKVIGEDVVTIDASNLKKDVDTVKVDSSIVNAIANNEDCEGLEIKLSDGMVTFDADAVAGFKGGDLSVTWDKTNTNSLNSKQKDAVKDMDVQGSYKLTLNKALKNGEAEIRAAFAVPDGKDASDLALVRIDTDGTAKEVSARFSGGEVRFTATESGDYVVIAKAGEQTEQPAEPVTPVQNSTEFRDVDAGAWYGNAVQYVAANGLMSGVGDGLFAPNTNLSRAMLAQILYNHAGRPAVSGESAFTDVPAGMWFTNAVAWATAQGVVSGYGNGLFGPNDNITREQLAVMLYRYAGSPAAEGSLSSFADAGKVSAYAQNALIWATTNGVMSGKGGGNLDPAGLATRAEVAQMLYNYLNR